MLRVAVSTARGPTLQADLPMACPLGVDHRPGRGGGRLVLVEQDARLSPPK